jgi:hypothetical protein
MIMILKSSFLWGDGVLDDRFFFMTTCRHNIGFLIFK